MGKDKLRKFAEVATFSNVFQIEEGKVLKGKWASEYFGNSNPVILELACGKGEYTVNLAKLFPEKNFIGIDYKGNRIWRGAKTALEEGIPNLAFIRMQIEKILEYFEENALLGQSDNPRQTYIDVIMPAKIELNKEYLNNPTLANDIKIMWQTFLRIIR